MVSTFKITILLFFGFCFFVSGGSFKDFQQVEFVGADERSFSTTSRGTSFDSSIDSSCNEENSAFSSRGFTQRTKHRIRSTCTMKLLKRRFPPLQWLPSYTLQFALYDFMAGLTVAVSQ